MFFYTAMSLKRPAHTGIPSPILFKISARGFLKIKIDVVIFAGFYCCADTIFKLGIIKSIAFCSSVASTVNHIYIIITAELMQQVGF